MNQENQPEAGQSTVNSEQSTVNATPFTVHRSQNSFLVILLSILLLISCVIAGFFAYQTQQLVNELRVMSDELKQTLTPEPTYEPGTEPEPIPLEVLTKDWKTYTNEKYGFSFKHPSDLKIDQVSSSPFEQYKLVFMGEKQKASGRTQTSVFDGYIFYISFRGSDSFDKVAQDTYNSSKQNCFDQTEWSEIKDTTVDGRRSKTYDVVNCMGDYTENFVTDNGNTFAITQIYVGEEPEYSQYKNITKTILSTFKFTN